MRTILLPALLLLLVPHAVAQDDDEQRIPADRMQEIKAQRTAFITQQLDLTPEEAQKFWPVYNQFDKELESIRTEMRDDRKGAKRDADLTEAEASAAIEKEMASRQKELDVRKKYVPEFKKAIGAVKTFKLAKAERDFRRELIKRVRDRMQERGGPGGGGGRRSGRP